MQYRLNEAVGRPFNSSVNGARMIGSGVFDRHPNLQVLIVHMGGELASVLGRLEFTWRLNYKGIRNPPAGRPYKNERPPSDYFKTNIVVDRAAPRNVPRGTERTGGRCPQPLHTEIPPKDMPKRSGEWRRAKSRCQ